ncbi:FAD-binding oxidoreductase, partial [Daejeonella sp.]|uniref:NAD(P)/FAD-dependent oxidoreductase n=1 Tax=Daejeonella sp. TaxID=2805397 RepID=UPI0030BF6CA7
MKTIQDQPVGRDGNLVSPWQSGGSVTDQKSIPDPAKVYDCIIVGAGITGITAALILRDSEKEVLVIDAHNAGYGTTGGTSAHINTFADTTYKETESAFGKEGARLFAGAVNTGFDIIRKNIEAYNITCDFQEKPGYVYAEDDDQVKQLEDLYEGTLKVNVPISYVQKIPVPI